MMDKHFWFPLWRIICVEASRQVQGQPLRSLRPHAKVKHTQYIPQNCFLSSIIHYENRYPRDIFGRVYVCWGDSKKKTRNLSFSQPKVKKHTRQQWEDATTIHRLSRGHSHDQIQYSENQGQQGANEDDGCGGMFPQNHWRGMKVAVIDDMTFYWTEWIFEQRIMESTKYYTKLF